MKFLALGGAGQEGSRTVRDLVLSAQVDSVVIGDLNLDAANQLKKDIGSDKVSTLQVDATVHAELIEALKGVDVVITFVAPTTVSACRFCKPPSRPAAITSTSATMPNRPWTCWSCTRRPKGPAWSRSSAVVSAPAR